MVRSVNRGMPLQNSPSAFLLSSELSSETLKALGELSESSAASGDLDGLVDAGTATVSFGSDFLAGLITSPLILAVPIGGGLLLSFLVCFFIYSWAESGGSA
eukprot:gene3297-3617_t